MTNLASPFPLVANEAVLRELRECLNAGRLGAIARVSSPHTEVAFEGWFDRHRAELGGREVFVLFTSSTIHDEPRLAAATTGYLARYPNVRIRRIAPYRSVAKYRAMAMKRVLALASAHRALHARGTSPVHIIGARSSDIAVILDVGPKHFARSGVVFEVLDEGFAGIPAAGWGSISDRLQLAARSFISRGVPTREHLLLTDARIPGRARRDDKVVSSYRQVIARHQLGVSLPQTRRPRALLLTSYLSEIGWAPLEAEQRACSDAVKRLDELGYSILLKPHPREARDKYATLPAVASATDLTVLDSQVGAEAFFPLLTDSDVVVGLISNALFTAQVLFRLRVFVLPGEPYGFPTTLPEKKCVAAFVDGLHEFAELAAASAEAEAAAGVDRSSL